MGSSSGLWQARRPSHPKHSSVIPRIPLPEGTRHTGEFLGKDGQHRTPIALRQATLLVPTEVLSTSLQGSIKRSMSKSFFFQLLKNCFCFLKNSNATRANDHAEHFCLPFMSVLSELQDLPNGLTLSPSHLPTASSVDGYENHICRQQMSCRYQAEACQDHTD